uniref:C-type lectin domain-containing protein n=1 Tax=Pundamilia nyererei TaxID=303518 RepID=A0A3B4F8F5_9CICH
DWKFLEQNIDISCPCIDTLLANKISRYYEKQTWPKAQSYCRTHHTDLASIRSNGEKSNIALAFTGSGFTQTPIGLYRDPWTSWSDNSTSMLTNWGPSQPNNYLLQQSCTLINLDLKTIKSCSVFCCHNFL